MTGPVPANAVLLIASALAVLTEVCDRQSRRDLMAMAWLVTMFLGGSAVVLAAIWMDLRGGLPWPL